MKTILNNRARLALIAALSANSLAAASLAPLGTGIIGVNDAIDADAGIPRVNSGLTQYINDQDPFTRVDTWFGADPAGQGQGVSFVGIAWPAPRFENITTLTLTIATFTDGGWFGVNGIGPVPGEALTSDHLREPTIQVSTNGTEWATVAHTSDYLTVMNGHLIGGGANPNPTEMFSTFTLTTPVSGIRAIRIIGENGGAADGNGFLGVLELAVEAADAPDTDSDGLPDPWEQAYGLSVGSDDSASDPDSDGLPNSQEFFANTNPSAADTDGDGLNDGAEANTHGTNPSLADTDGDSLPDGAEVNTHGSDPLVSDTDGDTLNDGVEVNTHQTSPSLADTDNDGYSDFVEITQGSDPKDPAIIPNNIALFGRGIMGVKDSVDSGIETELELFHVGTAENIVDGNLTTRVDTYNESDLTKTASFVGVVWDAPMTNTIASVRVTLATFFDGGWFGQNGTGPGAGNALAAEHLIEPRVEVTTDNGASWNVAPSTSDYLTALTGHRVGGGALPNPTTVSATFTLNQPTNGISGIRIVGSEGGQASAGFIGVFDFAALTSSTDVDSDGLDDTWERQHSLNVGVNDAAQDPDSDGLTNIREFEEDTDPRNADSDTDGLNDGPELSQHNTHPLRADTDTDGLNDGPEINTHNTNPLVADTDGDGYNDGLEVAQGTNPASASSFPSNIAPLATAIIGTRGSIEDGTDVPRANAGSPQAINDFNPDTVVDTFGGLPGLVSYVGLVWDEAPADPIVRLELTMAVFFDGGWFGPNDAGPGSGGILNSNEFLIEPTVQVTTDNGATWQTVAHTSDYLEVFHEHPLPAVDFGAPTRATATFEFAETQTGINGVRIVGSEGGTASGGFIGVYELAAYTETGSTPTGLTIQSVTRSGSDIQFSVATVTGSTHVVQYKNSLSDAQWQTLTTLTGNGTTQQVTDSAANPSRFYRVTTE